MAKQLCEYAWMQLPFSAPFPAEGRMRTTTCVPGPDVRILKRACKMLEGRT